MTITYNMSFNAEPWQEAFLNIGKPNLATEGVFPHPAAVLAKCYVGVRTDEDVDHRLGLNEHNLAANTGKNVSDADTDSAADIKARLEKSVEGQNLQNLNFYETDFTKYPQFDTSKAYKRGDVVVYATEYSEDLYRFLTDHAAGDWNANEVQMVNYRSNGGYLAEDDNLNYLGLNERIPQDIDAEKYTGTADSDPMNVVTDGKVMGQNINNFDHGSLFNYDDTVVEPEVGPFLGLGDETEYATASYLIAEFSPDVKYSPNDKVLYDEIPYAFNQSHFGPWDATHVVKLDNDNKFDRNVLNDLNAVTDAQHSTILQDNK